MFNFSHKNRRTSIWNRERTDVIEVITNVRKMKWSGVWHVNRLKYQMCTSRFTTLISYVCICNNYSANKGMVWFYIALYPVRWTAQSALHFPTLADLFIPTPFSASLGSILAMQQLRNDYSLTFPPLSIARYSFIQLSRLRRREVKENAQTSKR